MFFPPSHITSIGNSDVTSVEEEATIEIPHNDATKKSTEPPFVEHSSAYLGNNEDPSISASFGVVR